MAMGSTWTMLLRGDACFGIYEELVKYLVQRYPKIFRLERDYTAQLFDPRTVPMPREYVL
jgi:hypothetical protein